MLDYASSFWYVCPVCMRCREYIGPIIPFVGVACSTLYHHKCLKCDIMDVAALIHKAQDDMIHPFRHGQKVTLPHLSEIFSSPHMFRPISHESDSDCLSDSNERHGAKKKRCNLPKETTDILMGWLENNLHHPYPTAKEKIELVYDTGLSHQQLSNWFINARRRRIASLRDKQKSL